MKRAAILIAMCIAPAALAGSVKEDLKNLRERLAAAIVSRDTLTKEQIVADGRRHADRLAADGIWPDIDYTDQSRTGWQPAVHLERMRMMARACHIARDDALLGKLRVALDVWLRRDPRNPNWWHNEIGCPLLIGSAVLLVQDDLSPQQIDGVVRIMRRCEWQKWAGANLVWGATIQIIRGVIERDVDAISEAYVRFYEEIRISEREGVQPDFSFHQHGAQLYSGGYGQWFAADGARYASFAWGTRWQIPDERLNVLLSDLLDGTQWMMHRDRWDYSALGREIVRPGKRSGDGAAAHELLRSVAMLSEQPTPRQHELVQFVARMRGDDADPPLLGSRHFWRSDYMTHHGRGWFVSVKMFSSRLLNAELVNEEGKQSHHLADGANFIYIGGNEYFDIFPCWDWTRVPGTTAEQGTLDIDEERSIGIKGKTDFVGGVADGEAGLAVMHLARGKLAARKFWFFFGDAYLCMGAGITCDSDRGVATTINQSLVSGPVNEGANWLHHDRVGYAFREDDKVHHTVGDREGRWIDIGAHGDEVVKKDVFTAWIDHGAHPRDAKYGYLVMPNATRTQTVTAAKEWRVIVLANTDTLQAALDPVTRLAAIAFHAPGEVRVGQHVVSSNRACLVLWRIGKQIAVSNPANELMTVDLRIDDRAISIDLPGGPMAGSTVVRELH